MNLTRGVFTKIKFFNKHTELMFTNYLMINIYFLKKIFLVKNNRGLLIKLHIFMYKIKKY